MYFRSQKWIALFLPILLPTSLAFAAPTMSLAGSSELCSLHGKITLTADAEIYCPFAQGPIEVDDQEGAEIVTNGHALSIYSQNQIHLGEKGLRVVSPETPSVCGRVTVYTPLTATGTLGVDNRNCVGGEIDVTLGSSYEFKATLYSGQGAKALLTRGGETVSVEGQSETRL